MAKRHHFCLDCRYHQSEKYVSCPSCGSKNRQYFPSDTELKRGASLMLQRDMGEITGLRFQPRYKLEVNGKEIAEYRADAEYYRGGMKIIEDSKPPNYMDDLAKIKIRLFEALYGITVTIPQKKR